MRRQQIIQILQFLVAWVLVWAFPRMHTDFRTPSDRHQAAQLRGLHALPQPRVGDAHHSGAARQPCAGGGLRRGGKPAAQKGGLSLRPRHRPVAPPPPDAPCPHHHKRRMFNI